MNTKTKRINLALQGGGSHGAYTWGALDALLADERIEIVAISGASAGAMNAVVLADGLRRGGAPAARENLGAFWKRVSHEGAPSAGIPIVDAWVDAWRAVLTAPSWLEAAAEQVSPYIFNPLNLNPLREMLEAVVDFDALRKGTGPKLFVAATNVYSGRGEIFRREILTADHVLASACLPRLFQAVMIDGLPYWDGGFAGNPPLWPLFYETNCRDCVIVQINPIDRHTIPQSAEEITNRMNEITFNAGLLAELRAADFVARLIETGALAGHQYRGERLHRIGGHGKLESFEARTKRDVSWGMLTRLRDLGRDSATQWLDTNFESIGQHSTLDIAATLQKPGAS